MTDKELIQALRHCAGDNECGCIGCPGEATCDECSGKSVLDAADRLEALLAENEHLREVTKMVPPSTEGVERMSKNVTNAQHIRAMSDEELVDFLWQFNTDSFENVMPFCKNTEECDEKLDSADISTEMCKRCLLDKLQQPYESEGTPCST